MTQKVYKTSRGKAVDIGALRLQNEHVRAVGNMNVNARGDRIDGEGNVIDSRTNQYTRSVGRTTNNPTNDVVHTSSASAKKAQASVPLEADPLEDFDDEAANTVAPADPIPEAATLPTEVIAGPAPVVEDPLAAPNDGGGLAAAIARAKTVKQELEKTARQQAKEGPVRKI
jgi:hypothetical protein